MDKSGKVRKPSKATIERIKQRIGALAKALMKGSVDATPAKVLGTFTESHNKKFVKVFNQFHAFFFAFGEKSPRHEQLYGNGRVPLEEDLAFQFNTYAGGCRSHKALAGRLRQCERFVGHQLSLKRCPWSLTPWQAAGFVRLAADRGKTGLGLAMQTLKAVSEAFGIEACNKIEFVKSQKSSNSDGLKDEEEV